MNFSPFAHIDHVGIGAPITATGSTTARWMTAPGARCYGHLCEPKAHPKNSALDSFLARTAEEKGLLGSNISRRIHRRCESMIARR